MSDSFGVPWTVAHQAPLSVDFPGKNTRVGCHFLLQGILTNQGLNPCLSIGRRIVYHWAIREALETFIRQSKYIITLFFLESFSVKEKKDTSTNWIGRNSVIRIWIENISMNFSTLFLALTSWKGPGTKMTQ